MQTIDPIQLQRLIDGELGDIELRELLEKAKLHPEFWQQVAIGFIEDQQWQAGFRKQVFENGFSQPNEIASSRKQSDDGITVNAVVSVEPHRGWKWFGLAAALLVALTIGFLSAELLNKTETAKGTQVANLAVPDSANLSDSVADQKPSLDSTGGFTNPVMPVETKVDYRPDFHLELHDAHGNPVLEGQVPLYTYDNAKKLGYSLDRSRVPQELRDSLSDSGYLLSENVNYISGALDDGRQFVLPVRTISFSPGQ